MSPRATVEAGVIEGQFLKALTRLKSLTGFIVYACSVPMVSNNHSHFVHAYADYHPVVRSVHVH